MRDLRVALDDLADEVLTQVGALRVDRQLLHQVVETLQKQRVAFFRYLFGLTQGCKDGAQVGEQGEVVFQLSSGVGHAGDPLEQNRAREYKAPAPDVPLE